jgi:hypothetical protein
MKRTPLVFAALICIAAVPSLAQQLQQPTVPTTKPVTPPPSNSGVGPKLDQAQPAQVPRVASDPNQRPQAPDAIPSTGPAREVPTGAAAPGVRKKPAKVLDANGKPVNGLIQIAPNRVYDPATGKYHWTERLGQEQKLLDN